MECTVDNREKAIEVRDMAENIRVKIATDQMSSQQHHVLDDPSGTQETLRLTMRPWNSHADK